MDGQTVIIIAFSFLSERDLGVFNGMQFLVIKELNLGVVFSVEKLKLN